MAREYDTPDAIFAYYGLLCSWCPENAPGRALPGSDFIHCTQMSKAATRRAASKGPLRSRWHENSAPAQVPRIQRVNRLQCCIQRIDRGMQAHLALGRQGHQLIKI